MVDDFFSFDYLDEIPDSILVGPAGAWYEVCGERVDLSAHPAIVRALSVVLAQQGPCSTETLVQELFPEPFPASEHYGKCLEVWGAVGRLRASGFMGMLVLDRRTGLYGFLDGVVVAYED